MKYEIKDNVLIFPQAPAKGQLIRVRFVPNDNWHKDHQGLEPVMTTPTVQDQAEYTLPSVYTLITEVSLGPIPKTDG